MTPSVYSVVTRFIIMTPSATMKVLSWSVWVAVCYLLRLKSSHHRMVGYRPFQRPWSNVSARATVNYQRGVYVEYKSDRPSLAKMLRRHRPAQAPRRVRSIVEPAATDLRSRRMHRGFQLPAHRAVLGICRPCQHRHAMRGCPGKAVTADSYELG